MHLLDLSPACVRISFRTNVTCCDEVARPGGCCTRSGSAASWPLLGTPACPAGKRSRFQATAPGPCPLHTARWHLDTCAESSKPHLVHQRPAAPLDGEVAYPFGRFVPTKSALVTPATNQMGKGPGSQTAPGGQAGTPGGLGSTGSQTAPISFLLSSMAWAPDE